MATNTERLTEPQLTLKTGDIDGFHNNRGNRNGQFISYFP